MSLIIAKRMRRRRRNRFEGELKTMFLDHESGMKTSVPGKRALRFERHVQVDTETKVFTAVQ